MYGGGRAAASYAILSAGAVNPPLGERSSWAETVGVQNVWKKCIACDEHNMRSPQKAKRGVQNAKKRKIEGNGGPHLELFESTSTGSFPFFLVLRVGPEHPG